ncbi:MAG: GAF domain-containing protein, partial [Verrucomicrobia bacterium]|nr:GAF domain-containing protein [Verrucomicrobiota bacterium]
MSLKNKSAAVAGIALALLAFAAGVSLWNDTPAAIMAFTLAGLAVVVAGWVITGRYVTERRRAEEMVLETDPRFRRFTEVALAGVYIIEGEKFRYVNPGLARMFGYEPHEVVDRLGPADLTHPADRALVMESVRKRLAGEVDWLHYTFRGLCKDGRGIEVECLGRRTDYHGRPALMGTLLNVTERKRDEERVRLQSAALDAAANGIVITDRDGQVIWVNPAFTTLTGYEPAETLGRNIRLLKSGQHDDEFFKQVWDTVLGGAVWHGEMVNRRKDGKFYTEEQTITPVSDSGGRITHFIAVKQDVTSRRHTEEELQQRAGFMQLLQVVAVAANEATSGDAALRAALTLVCAYTGWAVGHVYLVEPDGGLAPTDIWHLKDPQRLAAFRNATEQTRFTRGVGLPGQVLATGRAVYAVDLGQQPDLVRARAAVEAGLHAAFGFPVWVGSEIVAVIEFFSEQAVAPDERLQQVILQIGTQLGRVIERQRAVERVRAEAHVNAALLLLETTLNRARGTQAVCSSVVTAAPTLLPGAQVMVWTWDDDREILHPIAAPQELPERARASFLKSEPARQQSEDFAAVLRTQQAVCVTDTATDPRACEPFWQELGIHSFLLEPLLAGDRLLGVIAFGRKEAGAFNPREAELARGAAQRVAMALQGEQAREEAQRQLDHVRLLNQITRAIADRQDLASIFRVVLEHLEDYLPVDLGVICQAEAAANGFSVAAHGRKSAPLAAQLGLAEGAPLAAERTSFRQCLLGHMVCEANTAAATSPLSRAMAEAGLRSAVATPLTVEDRLVGILLTARRAADGFSSSECEFLRMLSEHVALAADDARLRDNLQAAYNELRETHRAAMQQERLRALGQMASGIAHDINNAISPIAGYTELLLSDETSLNDRNRRYVEIIQTACGNIAQIVGRLRDFYRQRGQRDLFAPVNLDQAIRHVLELTRPRWRDIPHQQGHVVDLRTDIAPDLPAIMGIESEIREALTNLIINAVDAMSHGGTVTIRAFAAKEEPPASDAPHGHLIVEVADTGAGMDEETRRRCLEPFYSTKGEHGTGLGLSLVYGAMQRHEGDIQIE